MVTLAAERPRHGAAIERLLDDAFGAARWQKTCQRLRDGRQPLPGLSLVALAHGRVVGTLRQWRVLADGRRALLLGPLAVEAAWRNRGIGSRLTIEALRRAEAAGETAALLVGDAAYYRRFGFDAAATRGLHLPGPVERERFLARELVSGALAGCAGPVTGEPIAARAA